MCEGEIYNMPIYNFKCIECSKNFEVFQKNVTEKIKYKCPICASSNVDKIISQTSFILKGEGWANDKYSTKKQNTKEKKNG